MKSRIISALDIGSHSVKAIIAQKIDAEKNNLDRLQIIGVGQTISHGIRKGVVIDIEETIKAINSAKQEAEQASGVPLEHAFVCLEGSHIFSEASKGTVAISRADGEVSEEDILRAVESAKTVSIPNNSEILKVIPRNFIIDGQQNIKSPIGMNGVRLEVDALVVQGLSPFIKNLEKCIIGAGIDIDDLVLAPLVDMEAVLDKRQKELGVALINLGGGTTDLLVCEEGDILKITILPIGCSHITSDIAIGLRTSIETAEKVKTTYGAALQSKISDTEKINLKKLDKSEKGFIDRIQVAEIIEARLQEIFSLVNKELKKIDKQGMLPAGAVLVGGGAKMPYIVDLAKESLSLPAQVGLPRDLEGMVDEIEDPEFVTAAGLIIWGARESGSHRSGFSFSKIPLISGAGAKMKNWLRAFLP